MFNIGFSELILILLVAFLVVGPKDLPKVARALARGVRYLQAMFQEFKDETGLDETIEELKGTEADIKQTLADADPTRELREAKRDADRTIREAKKIVSSKPTGTTPK